MIDGHVTVNERAPRVTMMIVLLLVLQIVTGSAFRPVSAATLRTVSHPICAASQPQYTHRMCSSDQPPPTAPAVSLTGGQRRTLRSHAGRLAAGRTLVYVNVAEPARSRNEVDQQLTSHELVRCKFAVMKKSEAKVMAAELATLTGAAVAEVLGHTALLYRPSQKRLIPLE